MSPRIDLARVRALFVAELLGVVRDRWALVALIVVHLGIGALGPLAPGLAARFTPVTPTPDEVEPTWACAPGSLPKVALLDVPDWVDWPDPTVEPAEADALVTWIAAPAGSTEPGTLEVLPLGEKVGVRAVADCLRDRVGAEARRRLDALGIPEDPDAVVVTRVLPPTPPVEETGLPREIPRGVAVVSALVLLVASVFLELGPRARASGWLETWLVLPGARADLVAAWYAVGLVLGAAGVGLVLAGDTIGTLAGGVATTPVPAVLIPAVLVLIAAVGVRAFLDVPDLRTAMVQSVPVLLVLLLLTALARVLEVTAPGWGGWLPVGGLLLAVVGRAGDGNVGPVVSGLGAAAFLLWDSARAIERLDVKSSSASRTAARRALGNYRPEAVLLVLVAMAGMGAWVPPELLLRDLGARTAISMVLFLGAPAVVTPWMLQLSVRETLSWRAPRKRAFAAVPLVVVGTLSLGSLAWKLGAWLFPANALTAAFEESMRGLDSPVGLVAITVLPGLCEELLFRGAILGLLRRRMPTWLAVVLQAAAFSVLHGLAVRLPHTFALGLLFGALTVGTGSIWPGMIAHFAHNLLATQVPPDALVRWADTPWAWVGASVGIAAVWGVGRRGGRTGADA